MLGLMVLGFFALYFGVSFWATRATWRWAKNNQRSKVWAYLVGFAMYNLVFWDWIPTLVVHEYLCETQAGVTVYKTPVEWEKENPDVFYQLKASLSPTRLGLEKPTANKSWLNQRLYHQVDDGGILFIRSRTEQLVDSYTSTTLVESRNYWMGKSMGVPSIGGGLNDIRQALIFSLNTRECVYNKELISDVFRKLNYPYWKNGEHK